MSCFPYKSGCILAMTGKNCIAVGTDQTFGAHNQQAGSNYQKIFHVSPHMILGLVGLQTNIMAVKDRLMFRKCVYEVQENRPMAPESFAALVSDFLRERWFGPYLVEPIVAALDPFTLQPFICNMDQNGYLNAPSNYVAVGSNSEKLYGISEATWKPDLTPQELFEMVAQAIISAFDTEPGCGFGATVYIVEMDNVTIRNMIS